MSTLFSKLLPKVTRIPWRFSADFANGLLGLLLLCASFCTAQAQGNKAYQVKAAFLYNFTKFVEWPSEKFADNSSPIVIGVLGKNSFSKELEAIVKDRKVNGRDLVVKPIDSPAGAKDLHVLFISSGEEGHLSGDTDIRPVPGLLTVGESEEFARLGGIINFTMEADKVRFEINMETAEKAGLKISAQLQKLAKVVRKKN